MALPVYKLQFCNQIAVLDWAHASEGSGTQMPLESAFPGVLVGAEEKVCRVTLNTGWFGEHNQQQFSSIILFYLDWYLCRLQVSKRDSHKGGGQMSCYQRLILVGASRPSLPRVEDIKSFSFPVPRTASQSHGCVLPGMATRVSNTFIKIWNRGGVFTHQTCRWM